MYILHVATGDTQYLVIPPLLMLRSGFCVKMKWTNWIRDMTIESLYCKVIGPPLFPIYFVTLGNKSSLCYFDPRRSTPP